jgi:hypothetical protein
MISKGTKATNKKAGNPFTGHPTVSKIPDRAERTNKCIFFITREIPFRQRY